MSTLPSEHDVRKAAESLPRDNRVPYQPLVLVFAAGAVGIVADRYGPSAVFAGAAPWLWAGAAASLVAWFAVRFHGRNRALRVTPWLLLLCVLLTGAAWHHMRWNLFGIDEIGRFAQSDSQPVCVEAVAQHAPRRLPALPPDPLRAVTVGERSQLVVSVRLIRLGRSHVRTSGECLLRVDGHLLGIRAGDRLRIFALLTAPREAMNPGAFNFRRYARADRRLCGLRANGPDCVSVVVQPSRFSIQQAIDEIRQWGDRLLLENVGSLRSGLAAAILLGAREGLPSEATESYLTTGTIHLLVISGLHVGILAMGLFFAQRAGFLPRNVALVAAVALVTTYALIADARPPVMRAAVLTILVCVAMVSGRRAVRYNSLAAAALVVLAVNPCDLFRTGPQLSFLSVGTLIWYGNRYILDPKKDPLDRLIAQARPPSIQAAVFSGQWVAHIVLATLAVWLTALPLTLHRFHIFAPVAVIISPAVWILTYFALMAGFLLLAVGWVIPGAANFLGGFCNASLGLLEATVNTSQRIPGGHSWWPGPETWWIIGFYWALVAATVVPKWALPRRWFAALLAIWVTAGLVPPLWEATRSDRLVCSCVSVGHGACVVLQTPNGKTILCDAGSFGSPYQGARTIASYLWSQGITRIDAVVLSHADVDHYNAVPDLLTRFEIGTIFVAPVMFEPLVGEINSTAPDFLRETITAAGVPIREIHTEDRLDVGDCDVRIEVLHPPSGGIIGNDNANSIVLLVEFQGRRILLPGDLESPGMDDLLAELPIDCDIVLAPHHGSAGSDPPGFAKWCSPAWVVISGGKREASRLAEVAFRKAGAPVLHTAEDGAVQWTIDGKQNGNGIRLKTWAGGW